MIAASFTNFPTGTRRYLPARLSWRRVQRRVLRWGFSRMTWVDNTLFAIAITLVVIAVSSF